MQCMALCKPCPLGRVLVLLTSQAERQTKQRGCLPTGLAPGKGTRKQDPVLDSLQLDRCSRASSSEPLPSPHSSLSTQKTASMPSGGGGDKAHKTGIWLGTHHISLITIGAEILAYNGCILKKHFMDRLEQTKNPQPWAGHEKLLWISS